MINAESEPGPLFLSAIIRHYVSDLLGELEAAEADLPASDPEAVDLSGLAGFSED